MRLISFEVQTQLGRFERIGALAHGTVVDLTSAYVAYLAERGTEGRARALAEALVPPDMVGFLEGGADSRAEAEKAIAYAGDRLKHEPSPLGPKGERLTFAEADIRWLAPVPRPPMIRDGILTLDHYKLGMQRLFKLSDQEAIPEAAKRIPIYWKPSRAAVAGHNAPIPWPKYTEKLDYEFELGVYIGRRGKDIPVEKAQDYIAGYTIFNDLGCRDLQSVEMTLRLGPTKAKDFEASKVMGPCLVTPEELPKVDDIGMQVRVNGEVWFDGPLGILAFTFAEFIAYVSRDETLQVGDLFGSGPPMGSVGFEMDRWIKPGDLLECEIQGIGVLSNRIVREG